MNGKSDGDTQSDYGTTAMLGVLPALFAERAEHAFVIGLGTGITASELSRLAETKSVTVAEISPGVIAAAPLFDFANHAVSRNPKVKLVHGDAYRTLARSGGQYDVIASEPSNPWVTGVEMLYSREFLAAARGHLTPLVLRTYASVFDHVAVWTVNYADVLLLGFRDPKWALDLDRLAARMQQPDFHAVLERFETPDLATLLAHETLPLGVVGAAALPGPVHSLYHPLLSFVAGRAFFTGSRGSLPFTGYGAPAEIGRANSLLRRYRARNGAEPILEATAWRACRAQLPGCGALVAAVSNAQSGALAPFADLLGARGSRQLERMQRLPVTALFPAHGPVMANAKKKIQEYIDHRIDRERKIFAAWERGHREPAAIVREVYTDVAPAMYALAERSVIAHLEKLQEERRIR